MHDPALIRAYCLLAPVCVTWLLLVWRRPERRNRAAALLAGVWNVPSLLLVHLLATQLGWWRFGASGGLLLGLPADLYLGWALLWGPIPFLVFPEHPALAFAAVAAVDLLTMPAAAPVVQLGRTWPVGEAVALAVCLLPAQLLARWTARDVRLPARVTLQFICFSATTLGALVAAILEQTGGSWSALWERPLWLNGLLIQALAVPAVMGLSAVQEFAVRGRGTPLPFDPPRRLVASGPYAYLANPMALAMCLLLLGMGGLLGSWWVAGAALVGAAYSHGIARWDETNDLAKRYGSAWREYRAAVRYWWPRWRPYMPAGSEARLYLAEGCLPCSQVARWLTARRPGGLTLCAAEAHPARDLRRLTYDPGGGAPEEEGVAALGRALEHLHLGWALAGWAMRLPVVRPCLQVLVDACGGAPRPIQRTAAGVSPAACHPTLDEPPSGCC